jgi:hypothetical protein
MLVVSYTAVSPLPAAGEPTSGGLFSVALSRGSPRVAVNNHPALWSPDVPRRHPRRVAAIHLGLPSPTGSSGLPAGLGGPPLGTCANLLVSQAILLDLAPGGVCLAIPVTRNAGGLLHRRFTLTGPTAGGLLSVALSRGSPRVAVSNHPALWSPDFPRQTRHQVRRDRPVGSLLLTCP